MDGSYVSMANFPEAKGFIIVFTCNHCPYAVAYEKRLKDLDEKYKKKGYRLIAINPNNPEEYPTDSYSNMQKRYKINNWSFPYLVDSFEKTYPKFGARKTPEVYVVQKEKSYFFLRYMGAIDNNYKNANLVTEKYLENAVNALLRGDPVLKTKTRAIGCSIKA